MLTARSDRLRQSGYLRSIVVVAVVVLLMGIADLSLAERQRQPWLGLRAVATGEHLVISWVQPAGLAWDAGIRPGDTVTAISGKPSTSLDDPAIVTSAQLVQVRSRLGALVTASAPAFAPREYRMTFLVIALCFALVAAVVFVLGSEPVAGGVMLGLGTAASTALTASIATPTGSSLMLAIVYVGLIGFGASTFLLFLTFPVNTLDRRSGRWAATGSVGLSIVLLVLYVWTVVADTSLYDILQRMLYGALVAELIGGCALAVSAVLRPSGRQREARQGLALVARGWRWSR